jgi:hypothetical protein
MAVHTGGMVCLSVSCECCVVKISTSGWSLVQISPTKCDVPNKCDREAPKREAMTPNGVEAPQEKKKKEKQMTSIQHNIL